MPVLNVDQTNPIFPDPKARVPKTKPMLRDWRPGKTKPTRHDLIGRRQSRVPPKQDRSRVGSSNILLPTDAEFRILEPTISGSIRPNRHQKSTGMRPESAKNGPISSGFRRHFSEASSATLIRPRFPGHRNHPKLSPLTRGHRSESWSLTPFPPCSPSIRRRRLNCIRRDFLYNEETKRLVAWLR